MMNVITFSVLISLLAVSLAMQTCSDLNNDSSLPSTSFQLILVNGNESSNALVSLCEKTYDGLWITLSSDASAIVGTHGVAKPGEKIEGDGKTPSGTFTIGTTFGWYAYNDPIVKTLLMDYRYIVNSKDVDGKYLDKFIDDATNAYYNQWVSGTSDATSYEEMRISAYKYGFVINYNTYPSIVAGKGSAIFFHIWNEGSTSTAGCVAMKQDEVVAVLQWLDKEKQPLIRIALN